jgi:hypothetical protein
MSESTGTGTGEALDYGSGDDGGGFDVTEPVDVGDLSTQQGNDVIDPFRKVRFEIRKASVREYKKDGEASWRKKFLALDIAVASDGVDGEGKFANKHFFPDLLLVANTSHYPELDTEHYRTKARFDTKVFLKALGYDPAAPPKINDEFLIGLAGKEVFADITRREIQEAPKEGSGETKWKGTGEYRNEIKNWRSVEAS